MIKVSNKDYAGYPFSVYNFTLSIRFCEIANLEYPIILDYTYLLKSGRHPITPLVTRFYKQEPDCHYKFNILSYWNNGTQFDPSIIYFTFNNQTNEMIWKVNLFGKKHEGNQRITVEYVIDEPYYKYRDNSLSFNVYFKY